MTDRDEEKGRQVLTAVERLVARNDKLRAAAADCLAFAKTKAEEGVPLVQIREAAGKEAVRRASNKAAVAGGVSGLPGLIPGVGLAATAGVTLAELAVLLKIEVELALVLLVIHGFDIDEPRERQLGFLLASVGTYDAGTGSNFLVDVAKAEGVAIWNYAPRRVGRMVVTALTAVVAFRFWRGLLKAVPLVGIAVGSSMNKVLTRRVGQRIERDLRTRRELLRKEDAPAARKAAQAVRKRKKVVPRRAAV
jgi:hypothetical protein